MKPKIGDKVRLKIGDYQGQRGFVKTVERGELSVLLEGGSQLVRVSPEDVTNFSLAARKAWVTGPDRAVGRRKGTRLRDRVSMTFRIDRDLWERFTSLEQAGVLGDRNAVVNSWFREKLTKQDDRERES